MIKAIWFLMIHFQWYITYSDPPNMNSYKDRFLSFTLTVQWVSTVRKTKQNGVVFSLVNLEYKR